MTDAARPPRAQPEPRAAFSVFRTLPTRWMDNDLYGHINNAAYYSFFDTAVNAYLIGAGALDIQSGSVIGLVIENHCNYFASLAFPEDVEAGLRVGHIGRSSVRYELGLFAPGASHSAASGHFIHVYVDRETRRPTELPAALQQALLALKVPA
ncbi:acyl-CoA thioesterase [Ideonella sp.]|uniref:acyl-CoA thioesterase n=1 Tax=Ideonella sp. TaxID=1929293 RepID=UPI003BB74D1C